MSALLLLSCPEYDRHLAAAVSAGKTMATAYLDPNLNHAFLGGAKSQLSAGGSDRTLVGSVDRVLKVFHHFETNTENSCWSSNIRYGDATDVRVRDAHFCLTVFIICKVTNRHLLESLVLFCNFITKYKNNDYKLLVAFKGYLFKISDSSRVFVLGALMLTNHANISILAKNK